MNGVVLFSLFDCFYFEGDIDSHLVFERRVFLEAIALARSAEEVTFAILFKMKTDAWSPTPRTR